MFEHLPWYARAKSFYSFLLIQTFYVVDPSFLSPEKKCFNILGLKDLYTEDPALCA